MTADIVQRFLHDAENADLCILGQLLLLSLHRNGSVEHTALAHLADQLAKRRFQSEIVERHRTHIEDDLTHIRQTGAHMIAKLLQSALRLLRVAVDQPLDDRSLEDEVRDVLRRPVVQLARNAQTLFLLRLDDLRADELALLRLLDLPDDAVDLIAQIAQDRADADRQMLRRLQDILQAVQAKLQGVSLRTKLALLLPRHAKLDLDILDRLVMLAQALLRIIAEIAARLRKLLFLSLLDFGKLVDLLDRLARKLAQILQRAPARLDLAARCLIDVKNLRLIHFDRVDRALQDIVQRLGTEIFDRAARKSRHVLLLSHNIVAPFFLRNVSSHYITDPPLDSRSLA